MTVQAVTGEHGAHAEVPFAKVPTGQVVAVKAQLAEPWGLKVLVGQGEQGLLKVLLPGGLNVPYI